MLFFLLIPPSYAVVINEIMYDPNQCEDSYCEWVEIFNEASSDINLSNWKLCGSSLLKGYINNSNGRILRNTTYILHPGQYAIISDGGTTSTKGTRIYSENFSISELETHAL